jgi:hypothetical protein
MTTAVFSFLGVVFGAGLQYVFTRYLENQRHHRALRSQAHADYVKCVCEQANLGSNSTEVRMREISAKAADAKARVCLYGSLESVRAFAQFEKLGAQIQSAEQRNAFVAMMIAMRRDSGIGPMPTAEDVELVLLGNQKGAS